MSKSQNLVPNPSFEVYSSCPSNTGQINYALPWEATISSPDYYNACATSTNVNVPQNFFGANYQEAKTGSAYAGIQTFVSSLQNMRENVGTYLPTSLNNGTYYLTKFHLVNMQCYKTANNNIALNFAPAPTYTVAFGNVVNLQMHVYKFGNPVIKDTLNWTEVMGIYKADGTEQYITIGNFKDDANTKIDTTNYGGFGYASYYLVDDVSVEPICTPFWSYSDTTVSLGDSVLIGPAITGLNINWYDASGTFITNAPGIYVKPNSPTFYTASEDFCNGVTSHTINVMVTPTGIKEYETLANSITVYPNPTQNNISINSAKIKTEELEILATDLIGKKLPMMVEKNDNNAFIDLQFLDNGIYFIQLYHNGRMVTTRKIIKE